MTVLLEVELMDPDAPELQTLLDTKCRTGVLLRKFHSTLDIPGAGVVCLFSFHDEACAYSFCHAVFGPPGESGEWVMQPVISGLFYTHEWL